jgi:DNA repair protein RadC
LNLSTLSRADLVSELLSPQALASTAYTPQVNNAEPICGEAGHRDNVLTHKLSVARELLLRDLKAQMCSGPVMASPQTIRDWLRLYCAGLEHEVFLVLYLNVHNALLEAAQLFRGTLTQTAVYPREVVKTALAHNAAAIVIAHSHPSGQAEPSRADEHLTRTLQSALNLVDVRLIDHFVVASDQLVSFAERGLL